MTEKTVEDYVEQIFPIQCRGRDEQGKEVLKEPIDVKVKIYKSPGISMICSDVLSCQYNTGGMDRDVRHPIQIKTKLEMELTAHMRLIYHLVYDNLKDFLRT